MAGSFERAAAGAPFSRPDGSRPDGSSPNSAGARSAGQSASRPIDAPSGRSGTSQAAPEGRQVILGARYRFEGLVALRGDGQIDGELKGDIVCHGSLWIGAEALLEGTIEADEVVLLGRLHGDVIARRRIELGPTAHVTGAIRAPSVALAEGCVLQGRCEMPTPRQPTAAEAAASAEAGEAVATGDRSARDRGV